MTRGSNNIACNDELHDVWIKLDDGFYDHPKTQEAGLEAAGLLVSAMTWSARHLTDGLVPHEVFVRLSGHHRRGHRLVQRLIGAGWLERTADGTSAQYLIHNWHDYQPSAEDVKARRRAATERKRRQRESARSEEEGPGHDVTPPDDPPVSQPPVPSRPVLGSKAVIANEVRSVSDVLGELASHGGVTHPKTQHPDGLNTAEQRHDVHVAHDVNEPLCRFCREGDD